MEQTDASGLKTGPRRQLGMFPARTAGFPACGFGRLSSRQSQWEWTTQAQGASRFPNTASESWAPDFVPGRIYPGLSGYIRVYPGIEIYESPPEMAKLPGARRRPSSISSR